MPRQPWSDDDLKKLQALKPGDHGAIARLAAELKRKPSAVSNKLAVLRRRRLAEDVTPGGKGNPFPDRRFY
jgi:hypothetical protein